MILIRPNTSFTDNSCRKQVRGFARTFSVSFLWAFFQWFFKAKEECGFAQFPTFGLQARKQTYDPKSARLTNHFL